MNGDRKDYMIKWRKDHKDHIKESRKQYYVRHREEASQKAKEYGITHKEQKSNYRKLYYEKNRLRLIEHTKNYYKQHHEKALETSRRYREANKDKIKEKRHLDRHNYNQRTKNRRYQLRGAKGKHSYKEWQELKKKYNYCCAICGMQEPFTHLYFKNLTEDHITPITKGGSNYITNIQPRCFKCNSKKGNR